MSLFEEDNSFSGPIDFLRSRVANHPTPQNSSRSRRLHNTFSVASFSNSKCIFCETCGNKDQAAYFSNLIERALYLKYSSSQNYYYSKDINEILLDAKTSSVIRFKDLQHFHEDCEYLKRFYKRTEHKGKLKMLGEYYKYHNEIPRIFIQSICDTVNDYHDRKRRIEYNRITKMLREDKIDSREMRRREKLKLEEPKFIPITNRVLDGLNFTELSITQKDARKEKEKSLMKSKMTKNSKKTKENEGKNADLTVESREVSVSNTIHDLNLKLGEIINNSYSQQTYFETSQVQPNDTISNLEKFLKHIQTNKQTSKLHAIPSIPHQQPDQKQGQNDNLRSSSPSIVRFTPSLKSSLINPQQSLITRKQRKILTTEPMLTLSPEISKRISPDNFELKRRLATLADEQKQRAGDHNPVLISAKYASDPNTPSALLHKNPSLVISKIRNFDEILKPRPHASPLKGNSQRSTSRESLRLGASPMSSRAQQDQRFSKMKESKAKELVAKRRESQTNLLKSKSHQSNKGLLDKNPEQHTEPGMQSPNTTRRKLREMRISVDIRALHKQGSYQEGSSHITTMDPPKSTKKMSQSKIQPPTLTNVSPTLQASKIISEYFPAQTTRESKVMGGLSQVEPGSVKANKKMKSVVPMIPLQKSLAPGQLSSRNEQKAIAMDTIPEKSMINVYARQEGTKSGVIAHHKYTKSDDKLERLDMILDKKTSLPVGGLHRNPENMIGQVGSLTSKQAGSSSARQMYAFNQTNVVNIYVNTQMEGKLKTEPNVAGKRSPQKKYSAAVITEFPPSTLRLLESRSPPSELVARNNVSPARKDYYPESGNESPRTQIKDIRQLKSKKEIYGGTLLNSSSGFYKGTTQQPKFKGKVELDLQKKEMKVNEGYRVKH